MVALSVSPGVRAHQAPVLLCPRCGGAVSTGPDEATCGSCTNSYPVVQNVIVYSHEDALYEDQMTETIRVPAFERVSWPVRPFAYLDFLLSFKQVRHRFLRDVVRSVAPQGPMRVLDVGSGGGKEVLRRLGHVSAVDISLHALGNARSVYDLCVRHDLQRGLPFEDASFDFVNCSDVLGHFDEKGRDGLLSEIRRVLRPGGHFTAFIETWSDVYDRNRRAHPDWYPRLLDRMVALSGHIGLEAVPKVERRLEDHGLDVLRRDLLVSSWSYARSYTSWAAKEFPPVSARERIIRKVANLAVRTGPTEWMLDDLLGLLSLPDRKRASPRDAIALLVHAVAS